MKNKMFRMSDRQIDLLKKESEKYQISEAEALRRMMDFYSDFYDSVKKIQVEKIEKNN